MPLQLSMIPTISSAHLSRTWSWVKQSLQSQCHHCHWWKPQLLEALTTAITGDTATAVHNLRATNVFTGSPSHQCCWPSGLWLWVPQGPCPQSPCCWYQRPGYTHPTHVVPEEMSPIPHVLTSTILIVWVATQSVSQPHYCTYHTCLGHYSSLTPM